MLSQETSSTTRTKQFIIVYCDILVHETNILSSSKDEQEEKKGFFQCKFKDIQNKSENRQISLPV